ncbi:hypothetical protein C8Q69DRAFT_175736 [Paecilomyces variotii]|uniref:Fungal-type protein kinase domain-containing protein n=1 Tax=Byssochlamys spectabilis TaxID=264951 RepID=A0A443I3H0_BYSSP|nr:hypothetical protein C8Q69DRAFT_175736 [Paecilomyces variotii]RWQ98551.1 hypothetical protein C8Q69DRAFT_175736 [Paecilomyces variotii]
MYNARIKYGFLSNYEQTIFLKQEQTPSGWELHYSDIIYHSTQSDATRPSLRACFWSIARLALIDHVANNNTPMAQWAKKP